LQEKKEQNMKVTKKKRRLIIDLPLKEPRASVSGKTLVVASSRGVRTTDVKIDGKVLCVSANAFFYPEKEEDNGAAANDSTEKPAL
jgi:hypothetical protein